MYKYGQSRFNQRKENSKDITQPNEEEGKTEIIESAPNNLEFSPNQRIAFKRGAKDLNEPEDDNLLGNSADKNYYNNNEKITMSSNINKVKSHPLEEMKKTSDFESNNKKLRNTMSGLNNDKMKYESGLIDIILKVEKDNVNHYLKGDLVEMYNDINKDNYNFKNNVFLANVNHFEKRTGILDKKPIIPYNCSEDISYKLDKYPRTNEIIAKFTERSKNFSENNNL